MTLRKLMKDARIKASFFLWIIFFCNLIQGQQPKLMLPIGHTGSINSANFSPDGKKIVTTSWDKTAKIWDVQTGKLIANLVGHSEEVKSAIFSSDGKKILTFSQDYTAKIWDAQNGKLLFDLVGHTAKILSAKFSTDGKMILTNSWDKRAKIWDVQTGKLLANLIGHTKKVTSAIFSPDAKKILTTSEDLTLKLWDAQNGKLLVNIAVGSDNYISATFIENGKNILTASWNHSPKVWDVQTGKLILELADTSTTTAEYISNAKTIVTTSNYNHSVKLWDAQNGKLLANIVGDSGVYTFAEVSPDDFKIMIHFRNNIKLLDAQNGEFLSSIAVNDNEYNSAKFSPDGLNIMTSSDYKVKIWDAQSGNLLINLIDIFSARGSFYSPDGNKIVILHDLSLTILNAQTGRLISEMSGHSNDFTSACFSPDGQSLVTAGDGTAKIWDVKTNILHAVLVDDKIPINTARFSPDGKTILTVSEKSYINYAKIWDAQTGKLILGLYGHDQRINSAVFNPDGKTIVTASDDGTAKIWETQTGKMLIDIRKNYKLRGSKASLYCANFSPDGKTIVTISGDTNVRIYAQTGKLLTELLGHSERVNSADFSPDSRMIVTASLDKTVKIWDVQTGKLLSNLVGHSEGVNFAIFSPDGKKIVTTSWDNTAKIWDAQTGKLLANLVGHSVGVKFAIFSPDGKKIVTASDDNTAKIWDAQTGKLLSNLNGHLSGISSIIFNADGNRLVTVSSDNTIKLWEVANGRILYTFLTTDSADYLVYDKDYRYDGTEGARKLIYFTCGSEIIELDQVKDLCWEPGLVSKINGINKEPITAKKLSDINICGHVPILEKMEGSKDLKKIKVIRNSGGIGEVTIYINQKEIEKVPVSSLVFVNNEATVTIDLKNYKNYFEPGKENSVQLQSRTADLTMSTKGAELLYVSEENTTTAPNLYAIIAGVSDYKGTLLDLKFAAKDASDFSNALQLAARKLLNIDGVEHVFVNTFVTGSATPPTKANISSAFAELKLKAKPNDIIVVYVSGHGEKFGTEATNFYYLTSDAGSFNLAGVEKEVAISTNEFADWLKVIPARKQILILDACASGKLAEDIAIAMRAAVPSDQIKALDRLNSRTGTFILSAAAANQSAYETSKYGQGLLTYSLLFGMKSGEALKDGKYVDVDKLFQYCTDKVKELANGIGGIQDPVISKPYGGASFDIGKIDADVSSKIILSLPKPIFTNSRLTNPETGEDNLGLENELDNILMEYASRGNANFVFADRSQLNDSFKLIGVYHLTNNKISITVRVKKGADEILKFEITDFENDKEKLAKEILDQVQRNLK